MYGKFVSQKDEMEFAGVPGPSELIEDSTDRVRWSFHSGRGVLIKTTLLVGSPDCAHRYRKLY